MRLARLNNTVERDVFECLIDFSECFFQQTFATLKETTDCFKDCTKIISKAIDRAKSQESSRTNEDKELPKKVKTVR